MGRSSKSDAIKTREHILDAAEHLFSLHGIGAVSVCQVAHASGYSNGAFYWHFSSKDALVCAIFERACSEILARSQRFSDSEDENPIEAIERFVLKLFHEAIGDGRLARLLSILLNYAEARSEDVLNTSMRTANERVVEVLAVAITCASTRGMCSPILNAERGARYVMGQLIGEVRLGLMGGSEKGALTVGRRNIRAAIAALRCNVVAELLNEQSAPV